MMENPKVCLMECCSATPTEGGMSWDLRRAIPKEWCLAIPMALDSEHWMECRSEVSMVRRMVPTTDRGNHRSQFGR